MLILFGVSVIIYSLARMMPTDFVDEQFSSALAQGTIQQEDIDRIKELYGLSMPDAYLTVRVSGGADSEFADRKQARAEAEYVCENLQPDDRVFYVSQGDNGEGWFSAVFDFYPVLVDYSGIMSEMNGGGGTFGLPELKPNEGVKATYYHAFTADELDAIVRGNGCTVLYIQKLDDIFVQSYSDLFTDKLAAAQAGETLLYRVTDAGYVPVEMQGGAA